jgi:hypothetical protein
MSRGLRFALSDQCHLRLFEEADAEELHRLVDTNRAQLTPWMPWAADETRDGALQFIRATPSRSPTTAASRQPSCTTGASSASWASTESTGIIALRASGIGSTQDIRGAES